MSDTGIIIRIIIRLAFFSSCFVLTQCRQVYQQACCNALLPRVKKVQVVERSPHHTSSKVLFTMKDGKESDELRKSLLALGCRQWFCISTGGILYNPDVSRYAHLDIQLADGDGRCIKTFSLLRDRVFCIDEMTLWLGEPHLRIHDLEKYFTEEEKRIILQHAEDKR